MDGGWLVYKPLFTKPSPSNIAISITPKQCFCDPPHRSARAGLLRLLPRMSGVEAQVGIGMKNGRSGKPAVRKSDKARPSEPVFLTAAPKRTHPTSDLEIVLSLCNQFRPERRTFSRTRKQDFSN